LLASHVWKGEAVMRRLSLLVLAASILVASAAFAQGPDATQPGSRKSGATKPGGTAPGAAARPGASTPKVPHRSWAKLCDTPGSGSGEPLLGKPAPVGVKTCLTHHEQLDASTGALRVAAGIQEVEGQRTFLVKVAAGMDQEPGVRLMILPSDLWDKVQKNQLVPSTETKRVRKLTLPYSSCNFDGCIAETAATKDLIANLKSMGALVIVTLKARQAFAYTVPLNGFREAYDGPPVDSAKFYAARAELLRRLRERQKYGLQPPLGPGGTPPVPPGVPGGPGYGPPPLPGGGQGVPPGLPGGGPYPPGGPPGDKQVPPPRPGGGQDI
jgi:invasion protein IalB